MANEVVKYHNDLNAVIFSKFTPVEMDLFFAIVSKARNKGIQEISFTLNEIMEISGYTWRNYKKLVKDLDRTYTKMLGLNYGTKVVKERQITYTRFVLFTTFSITLDFKDDKAEIVDVPNSRIDIGVNPKLYHILNELEQWTNYSLEDFVALKSAYSKTAYRLFKQFRTSGRLFIRMEDFREQFDVPKSYKIGQIDQKIVKPVLKELKPHFDKLKVKKIKSTKQGNPVVAFEFTWTPEPIREFKDFSKNDVINSNSSTVKSREMTPKWLKNEGQQNRSVDELTEEELEIEREKLRKELAELENAKQTKIDDYIR